MCPVPCRFESFRAHSAVPLNLVPTPHAFQPFQLQTLPFLHLPFPCPNNFSPTFLHCSLSFYWLLKKQTPTLSMSVTQFKAAEGLRGEDMSGDVWRVCKRAREWRAWEKSDKTKCHWSLAFLISFFRAIHFLRIWSTDIVPAGSPSWLTGTPKWNGAIINVISYTCAFPNSNLPSVNVSWSANENRPDHSKAGDLLLTVEGAQMLKCI